MQILPSYLVISFAFLASLTLLSFPSSREIWTNTLRFLISNTHTLLIHHSTVPSTLDASWENLKGGEHCLRFATREYTARLSIMAAGQDTMRACRDTPVEIHGRVLFTDFCQDLGFGRGVWGFWVVDFEEPTCETKWGEFNDLGCAETFSENGAPLRRVESRLENLQPGSNWQIMCVTTPADIYGRHFGSPAACFNDAKYGVFGEWDMQDTSCDMGFEP